MKGHTPMILFTMFLMGIVLGFTGTGGSGFIIALLVVVFGIPIHTALGVSLASMFFSTLTGSISHIREGNVNTRIGLSMGCFGALGAYAGKWISAGINSDRLVWMTGTMLIISGILIWIRTRLVASKQMDGKQEKSSMSMPYWFSVIFSGIGTGMLSGVFGIGSTPFIQLALLIFFGLSLRQAVGTTMLVIVPIAVFASVGFMQNGNFDWLLLLQVTVGTMTGSYIGAKFTKRAPEIVLRLSMMSTPIAGGLLLLFRNWL
jgi:uncharacterized membrane protein YfcA